MKTIVFKNGKISFWNENDNFVIKNDRFVKNGTETGWNDWNKNERSSGRPPFGTRTERLKKQFL